jgi:hypothetical protein
LNLPLSGLTPTLADGDLFGDPEAVHMTWNAIQGLFSASQGLQLVESIKRSRRAVVVLCYDGDASRLGTSILRQKGVEGFSVKRGFEGLIAVMV